MQGVEKGPKVWGVLGSKEKITESTCSETVCKVLQVGPFHEKFIQEFGLYSAEDEWTVKNLEEVNA